MTGPETRRRFLLDLIAAGSLTIVATGCGGATPGTTTAETQTALDKREKALQGRFKKGAVAKPAR